ncbi:MAG TPA: chorismate mutase [Chitinophagales bacterium]|nr:chorismate mutase [Chitinophagales bacterium]
MSEKFNITPLQSWAKMKSQPFIVAGPCSAEGEEQVFETVKQIVAHTSRVSLLRAGIWKPRTRPNSFEGVGEIGLPWIKNAGKAVGLPVTVEVANPQHVELALKNNIDVLWIGARTTVSPFNVQAIADSIKGVDIPVMIKNPVNPDIELWIGAVERFYAAGITKLAAIHRGFSSYEKSIYRNPPMWEIPIELRRRYPEIPIIVDPSHMGGTRDMIYPLAQQGMDMGFDGLMIETHINPDKAWSDAKQQVTPERLAEILEQLVVRQANLPDDGVHKLYDLRARVDRIDDYIIELLCERMGISEEIGEFKKEQHLAIHQAERWSQIVERAVEKGKVGGLTEEFILKLFQQIHNESIFHQSKVMEQKGVE